MHLISSAEVDVAQRLLEITTVLQLQHVGVKVVEVPTT